MPGDIFNNVQGINYEDVMTTVSALDNAKPQDRAKMLSSLQNTPMGDAIKNAVGILNPASAKPEEPKA